MGVTVDTFLNRFSFSYFPSRPNMGDLLLESWACPSSPVAVDQDLFPCDRPDARRFPVPRDFHPFRCQAITPNGLCPAHSTQSDATCSNPDHTASRRWYGQIIYWAWELRRPPLLPHSEYLHPAAQILVDPFLSISFQMRP